MSCESFIVLSSHLFLVFPEMIFSVCAAEVSTPELIFVNNMIQKLNLIFFPYNVPAPFSEMFILSPLICNTGSFINQASMYVLGVGG